MFATIHRDATVLLMDLLEKAGICGFAGKVCMDRNCPVDYRQEDARTSAEETRKWYETVKDRTMMQMILTPRLLPSCSDELMEQLGKFQRETGLYVQSHLSENSEALYLGTKGGGSFFGQVGSFEEGYEFDAVVLNDASRK